MKLKVCEKVCRICWSRHGVNYLNCWTDHGDLRKSGCPSGALIGDKSYPGFRPRLEPIEAPPACSFRLEHIVMGKHDED